MNSRINRQLDFRDRIGRTIAWQNKGENPTKKDFRQLITSLDQRYIQEMSILYKNAERLSPIKPNPLEIQAVMRAQFITREIINRRYRAFLKTQGQVEHFLIKDTAKHVSFKNKNVLKFFAGGKFAHYSSDTPYSKVQLLDESQSEANMESKHITTTGEGCMNGLNSIPIINKELNPEGTFEIGVIEADRSKVPELQKYFWEIADAYAKKFIIDAYKVLERRDEIANKAVEYIHNRAKNGEETVLVDMPSGPGDLFGRIADLYIKKYGEDEYCNLLKKDLLKGFGIEIGDGAVELSKELLKKYERTFNAGKKEAYTVNPFSIEQNSVFATDKQDGLGRQLKQHPWLKRLLKKTKSGKIDCLFIAGFADYIDQAFDRESFVSATTDVAKHLRKGGYVETFVFQEEPITEELKDWEKYLNPTTPINPDELYAAVKESITSGKQYPHLESSGLRAFYSGGWTLYERSKEYVQQLGKDIRKELIKKLQVVHIMDYVKEVFTGFQEKPHEYNLVDILFARQNSVGPTIVDEIPFKLLNNIFGKEHKLGLLKLEINIP